MWGLSQRTGCSVKRLRKANPRLRSDALFIGMTLTLPSCRSSRAAAYTVRKGDSLSTIAQAHGTTVAALQKVNGLGASTLIVVGRSLKLPGSASKAPSRTSTPRKRSESVGKPWKGKLVGGVQLPRGSNYYRRRTRNAYGTSNTVAQLTATLDKVHAKHRRAHKLAIGDLSRKSGGPLSGHRSHQSGRDIDIGFYFVKQPAGYPQSFVSAKKARLALGPMWTLIKLLAAAAASPSGPQYVFLDYGVQKSIYKYARKQGASKSQLRGIMQYPDGRGATGRLVRHEPNHADHLHVRYHCAPSDGRCR